MQVEAVTGGENAARALAGGNAGPIIEARRGRGQGSELCGLVGVPASPYSVLQVKIQGDERMLRGTESNRYHCRKTESVRQCDSRATHTHHAFSRNTH